MTTPPGQRVSLPMYDLPELRGEHAALLRTIASHLPLAPSGLKAVVDAAAAVKTSHASHPASHSASTASLDQGRTAALLWDTPDLIMTQMCGLALYDRRDAENDAERVDAEQLIVLGTPRYLATGCVPGYYQAWIVVRASDANNGTYTSLADLAGARVAVNHLDSFSGCIGLRAAAAWHWLCGDPPCRAR